MVDLGSGAKRSIKDIMLTRYACYLIAQNGDPSKEPIAFAERKTKKPRNLRCEAVPSPGYVTVVAQRIRGLTGYHGAKINLILFP